MHRFTFIALVFLQTLFITKGFINCKTACRECVIGSDSLDLMEVYCSMCKECRDSKRASSKAALKRKDPRFTTRPIQRAEPSTTAPTINVSFLREKTESSSTSSVSETTTTEATTTTTPPSTAEFTATTTASAETTPEEPMVYQEDDPSDDGWPEGCPRPPVCSEEEEKPPKSKDRCPPVPTCKPKTTTTAQQCAPCMPACYLPCVSQAEEEEESEEEIVRPETTPSFSPSIHPWDYRRLQPHQLLNQRQKYQQQISRNLRSSPPDYYYMYLGVPKISIGGAKSNYLKL